MKIQKTNIASILILSLLLLFSCSDQKKLQQERQGPTLKPVVSKDHEVKKRKNINWKKEIIYFVLIDRFNDGDPSNNDPGNKSSYELFDPEKKNYQALKKYQGGDLQGIIDKLVYLKELGATTIWLSPLMDNPNRDFLTWWPYHGYHPSAHYKVEDHFGNLKLLKELVKKAHSLGLKVILDMVFNHVDHNHPWIKKPENWKERGFKYWFHPHSGIDDSTSIKNWNDQEELETRELHGLPDFDQSNPNVYNFLLDVSKFWIKETECDGLRLDAVKHINPDFWKRINRDIHNWAGEDFILIGEVFSGHPEYLAKYQNLDFNSLFDFPLHYAIKRVFAAGSSMKSLSETLMENFKTYSKDLILGTFIDNHDVTRFAVRAGAGAGASADADSMAKTVMALTLINTLNGIPVINYGTELTEVSMLKGIGTRHIKDESVNDLLNRRPIPWSQVAKDDKDNIYLIEQIKKLLKFRKEHKSLYDGEFLELYKDYRSYVYAKISDQDISIVTFNNSSSEVEIKFPIRYDFLANGQELKTINGDKGKDGIVTVKDGQVNVRLARYSANIYNIHNSKKFKLPIDYKMEAKLTDK